MEKNENSINIINKFYNKYLNDYLKDLILSYVSYLEFIVLIQ